MSHNQHHPSAASGIISVLLSAGIALDEFVGFETTTSKTSTHDLWESCTRAYVDFDALRDAVSDDKDFVEIRGLVAREMLGTRFGTLAEACAVSFFAEAEDDLSLEYLRDACDHASKDLDCVATRLFQLVCNDGIPWEDLTQAIILDSVRVAPSFRGFGVGARTAAHVLEFVAAGSAHALIAATAGSQDTDDFDYNVGRAANLLGNLGLERFATPEGDLWVGFTKNARTADTISALVGT